MMQWTGLATKADLEAKLNSLETRLRQELASKEDLKAGLTSLERKLSIEIVKTNGRMNTLEGRLIARMNAGFDRVMTTIDSFAGKLETYGRESLTIPETLDQHGKKLKEHEQRLSRLESFQQH